MPNTNSAKKRLKQDEALRQQNRSIKSAIRTQVKKVLDAITVADAPKAEAEFRVAAKKLDKAAAHKVIHRNAAARKKSRLQKAILGVKQAS